jgi:hypothetical protein
VQEVGKSPAWTDSGGGSAALRRAQRRSRHAVWMWPQLGRRSMRRRLGPNGG